MYLPSCLSKAELLVYNEFPLFVSKMFSILPERIKLQRSEYINADKDMQAA